MLRKKEAENLGRYCEVAHYCQKHTTQQKYYTVTTQLTCNKPSN